MPEQTTPDITVADSVVDATTNEVSGFIPGTLEHLQEDPTVKAFTEKAHLNEILGRIYSGTVDAVTTQPLETAAELALAFKLKLEKASEGIVGHNVDTAFAEFGELIEAAGIEEPQLRALFEKVWVYSRLSHPVLGLLEDVLAELEGTETALVYGSGLAAISAAVRQFVEPSRAGRTFNIDGEDIVEKLPGGKIVVVGAIYGGTTAQLEETEDETGRTWVHMPISEFEKNGLPEDADMVYFETSNNPTLRVVPIPEVVEAAKVIGAITLCDNTFTPVTVKPKELGVDLVVHSLTKYANGRSQDLGGAVCGDAEMIGKMVDLHHGQRMVFGAPMAPRVAQEFMANIRDIVERLYLATENARAVAEIAKRHGIKARTVENYAAYQDVRTESIDAEAMQNVSNGMVTLYIEDLEEGERLNDILVEEGFAWCAVSLGAVHSYMSMPWTTTHSEMEDDEKRKVGLTPGMIRISCGTEPDCAEKFQKVMNRLYPVGEGEAAA